MTIKTMADLLLEPLKDLYYAENHIRKALPASVKKAGSSDGLAAVLGRTTPTPAGVMRRWQHREFLAATFESWQS